MGTDELRQETAQEGRWWPGGSTYEEEVAKALADMADIPDGPWGGGFPGEPAQPPFPKEAVAQVLGWLRWYTNSDDENPLWYARIPLEEQVVHEMGGARPEWEFGPAGNVQRREQ